MFTAFEPNSIVTMKLNSGEEIVTKLVSRSDTFVQIENPLSLARGPQGPGLVPSLFTADLKNPITLNKNSVSMICMSDDDIKDKFLELTTGITVPSKKILMG